MASLPSFKGLDIVDMLDRKGRGRIQRLGKHGPEDVGIPDSYLQMKYLFPRHRRDQVTAIQNTNSKFLSFILSRTVEPAVPPNGQSQTVTSCQPCRIDSPITKLYIYIAKVKYMYILSSTKKLLVNV